MDDRRKELLAGQATVPTSRWSRLFRAGKSGAAMARAVLARDDVDVDKLMSIVQGLGELKGVAMKAGQILGYIDPTLPRELREALSLLHTASAASPWSDVERTVREAFGDRGNALLAAMDRTPIAVASIGQVHRARIRDQDVVVKVRHRGIEEALRADFATAGLGSAFASLIVPSARSTVRAMIDEARTAMLEECDYALEAERQELFGAWFRDHETIIVPEVVREWCAGAVLTTRYRPGRSLDQLLATDPPQHTRDRIGVALFELYVGTLYERGAFHADPHPGNYAFTTDGRVIVYDFGCVREFDEAMSDAFAALVAAVRADEPGAIRDALKALGGKPASDEHVRVLLRGFFAPMLRRGPHRIEPGAALAANELFRDKRAVLELSLPGRLLFLFRIRFGLYAVLARLRAVADWSSLEADLAATPRGRPLPARSRGAGAGSR